MLRKLTILCKNKLKILTGWFPSSLSEWTNIIKESKYVYDKRQTSFLCSTLKNWCTKIDFIRILWRSSKRVWTQINLLYCWISTFYANLNGVDAWN